MRNRPSFAAKQTLYLVSARDQVTPFLCECDQVTCTSVVLLTLAEYEAARDSRRGLLDSSRARIRQCPGGGAARHILVVDVHGEAGRVAEAEAGEREGAA
jgi:hypothetical protein